MLTLISAELSEPPSRTTCFRDITLYSVSFLDSEVLLECAAEDKDIYWRWLKRHGAWDFISDIIEPEQEVGVSIRLPQEGSISVPRIGYYNLNTILGRLREQHGTRP